MRAFIALALFTMASLCSTDAHADAATAEKSPGGHSYIRIMMPEADRVAIQVAWPSDWVTRADVSQAVPEIGTRLILTGGAEGYPPGEVIELMSDLGAEGDLVATPRAVKAILDVERENLEETVKIVNAHLRAPALPESWFERARDELALAVAERRVMPGLKAADALRWMMYGDVPLRRAIAEETPERVKSITLADVVAWKQSIFTPAPSFVVIAGALDAEAAGKVIDGIMAGLPPARVVTPLTLEADMRPRRVLLHLPDAETSSLFVLGPMPSIRDGWTIEDKLLMDVMGRDMLEAVRSELRAAYYVGSELASDSDRIGFLAISAEIETARLAAAEELIRKRYAQFHAGSSPFDMADYKPFLLQDMKDRVKEPAGAADVAIHALETGQDLRLATAPDQLLAPVDFNGMMKRMAAVFPRPEALSVIAVSPDASALPGACVITSPEQAANCR